MSNRIKKGYSIRVVRQFHSFGQNSTRLDLIIFEYPEIIIFHKY